MQQSVVLFFLFVVVVVAAAPRTDERIVGGIPVTPDPYGQTTPFPYVVSIEYDREHFCGGFIYNSKWIVTTASCMENKDISRLAVVAGQVNLIDFEMTEERHEVFWVIPYETYNNITRKDDIALIELTTSVTLDYNARDLIRFQEVFTDDTFTPNGLLMGWGAVFMGGSSSTRLRYAEVTMVENDPVCTPYSEEEFTISSMICATSSTTSVSVSPCTSDDGSPLVQTYTPPGTTYERTIVVGVLSKYSPTCDPFESSVFTRLSVYYGWLYRIAGEQIYSTARR